MTASPTNSTGTRVETITSSIIRLGQNKNEALKIVIQAVKTAEKLGIILKKYEVEKDDLSQKILLEGRRLTIYVLENHTQPLETLLKEIIERVDSLKKILHNPFASSPSSMLKDPWLINSVDVWDKANLDELLECQNFQPPYVRKKIDAVPHAFAKEIIDWIMHLPTERKGPPLSLDEAFVSQVAVRALIPMEVAWQKIERCHEYEQRLTQKEQNLHLAKVNKELEAMIVFLDKVNQEGYEQFEQDLARQEQSHMEQTAQLSQSLHTLEKDREKTKELYQKSSVETREVLKKTQDTVKDLAAKAHDLQSRLDSAYAQLNNAHAQIADLANQDSGGCSIM